MKKFLLSVALATTAFTFANADSTVIFDGEDYALASDETKTVGTRDGNNINPLESVTVDGVKISFAKNAGSNAPAWYWILNSDASKRQGAAFRTYAQNSFTVTAPAGETITSIVFTMGKSDSNWPKKNYSNLQVDCGTLSPVLTAAPGDDFTTLTWTGEASEVTFTVPKTKDSWMEKTPQFRFGKAEVVLGAGGGPVAPHAPTISGPATFYSSTAEVTITAQEGTMIYYTMSYNGEPEDPTTSSTEYDDVITINNTATIKAIAVKDGLASSVASATFTKGAVETVANIAEFLTKEKNTVVTFENPVTVVGLFDKRYLFVKDETGSLQIFNGANTFTQNYLQGQTISGFTVKADVFNNNPQANAADYVDTFPAEGEGNGATVSPVEINASETASHLNEYIIIRDCTIVKDGNNYFINVEGGDNVQLYGRFNAVPWNAEYTKNLTDAVLNGSQDVVGFAVVYKTTPEIYFTRVSAYTGVGEINADDAVYGVEGAVVAPEGAKVYGINGVECDRNNLTNGLYIVVFNGKATKVVVR